MWNVLWGQVEDWEGQAVAAEVSDQQEVADPVAYSRHFVESDASPRQLFWAVERNQPREAHPIAQPCQVSDLLELRYFSLSIQTCHAQLAPLIKQIIVLATNKY